jgi:transcriptional regulator with XRE-family HTH domain
MGQEIRGIPQGPTLTPDADEAPDAGGSIGQYLASQRRLRGMSLEDLAALTRIPVRSIERLEDGAFDRQPDGFARGFVRTVAEALGLDVEEAVMRFLGEPAELDDERAIPHLTLRRWAVIGVLVSSATAAIFAIWLLWTGAREEVGRAAGDDIVYRRDAVRALAEMYREAESGAESLDSVRAEDSH